jgi:hypothetical protein
MYPFQWSLLRNLPRNTPITPYSIRLTIMAPINAEYLAIEPNVSTACDSISPGVSENKV